MAQGSAEVVVKSQLSKIISDLENIQKAASGVSAEFKRMSKDVGKEVEGNVAVQKNGLQNLRDFGRRVADQLRGDFKTLFSIGSLGAGLKISNQFAGTVKEAVSLSDTIRRLGSVFGIAGGDFARFQNKMQKGLGEIGLSSQAAANALTGLSETPVRGEENLVAYAKTAGELASISGERGSEANIAKGAAGIITARGGNPNDLKQLQDVTKEILQIRKATGASVTAITQQLTSLYSGTNKAFINSLKGGGSVTLATAALKAGPQATSFLENFIGKNKYQRLGQEAQGFANIIGKNGTLNAGAIQGIIGQARGRGLGDVQAGLTTMGLSDDEAKGFIRLADALKQNGTTIQTAKDASVDLNAEFKRSIGLFEQLGAAANKLKGFFSPIISKTTQGATNLLGGLNDKGYGPAAIVAGGGVLAALLASGGLRGIGGALAKGGLGGIAGNLAGGAIASEAGIPKVFVVNMPSGLPGAAGAAGLLSGGLGTALGVIGAAGAGAGLGYAASKYVQENPESMLAKIANPITDAIVGALTKVGLGPAAPQLVQPVVHTHIQVQNKDFKATTLPRRGAHQ